MCEYRFSLPSRAILDEGSLVHNTWLILSVVAALSQRLSHARFGISTDLATLLMAQERSYDALNDQVLFAFVSGTCWRRAPQFVVRFGISGPSAAERTSLGFCWRLSAGMHCRSCGRVLRQETMEFFWSRVSFVFTFGLLRVGGCRMQNKHVCMDPCVSMYVSTLSLIGLPT